MLDRKQLRKPDAVYRAAPFWSWNDDLKPRELLRQINLVKAGGWGGFFMHARVGRITEYLGKDWMRCTEACIKRAKQTRTIAYLYDEDRWPSGFAGGIVPRLSEDYHVRGLALVYEADPLPGDEVISTWEVEFAQDGSVAACDADLRGNTKVVAWKAEMGMRWFNNTCYVDLMNGEAVQAFLQSTHEEYAQRFGDSFGKQTLGIFTDEPGVRSNRILRQASVPWTPRLFDVFQQRRGYDPRPHTISLFLPVGDYERVRHDYYRTAIELFVENFSKPYYDWCEQHNLWLMGHYMAEDHLDSQIAYIIAAMPHYEYMHVPGMDHLGRNISNPLTAKQVSSVANQLGRERTMSETYGVSGQNMSFEDRKWIWDWHVALGINLENPHLWLYSMRGERKRDYPPTISHQQPYWDDNPLIADYSARLCYAMSQGREEADLLLLHPVESAWTQHEGMGSVVPGRIVGAECLRMGRDFAALIDRLLASQVMFDLGDEGIMAKHASVPDGKLRVGECCYRAAALPELVTIRRTTLDLLLAYQDAGGTVFAFGPVPTRVDGAVPQDKAPLQRLASRCRCIGPDVHPMAAMLDVLDPTVVLTPEQAGGEKIFVTKRRQGDDLLVFLANTDKRKECTVWVELNTYAALQRVDLETGQVEKLTYHELGPHKTLQLHFPPAGSHLLWCTRQPEHTKGKYVLRQAKPIIEEVAGEWEVEVADANALTLDYVKLDGADEPLYVLKAQTEIERRPERARFEIEYDFHVTEGPQAAQIGLVVERFTTKHQLFVNDTEITNAATEMWFNDVNFLRYDIDSLVVAGKNSVRLAGAACAKHGKEPTVEAVYVVGRFGVFRREGSGFAIGALPRMVRTHDLTEQGLLFFPGKVRLRRTFTGGAGATELRLRGVDAAVVEASLNGRSLGKRAWRPFDFAVPKGTMQAQSTIELTLTSTLRNLLGPHHHTGGELFSVGPGTFRDYAHWTDDYSFVPFGVKSVCLCP